MTTLASLPNLPWHNIFALIRQVYYLRDRRLLRPSKFRRFPCSALLHLRAFSIPKSEASEPESEPPAPSPAMESATKYRLGFVSVIAVAVIYYVSSKENREVAREMETAQTQVAEARKNEAELMEKLSAAVIEQTGFLKLLAEVEDELSQCQKLCSELEGQT